VLCGRKKLKIEKQNKLREKRDEYSEEEEEQKKENMEEKKRKDAMRASDRERQIQKKRGGNEK